MVVLGPTTIYKLVISLLTIPTYGYGVYEWKKYKRHFLIANRFPTMSYFLISLASLTLLISLIEDILYDLKYSSNASREISKFIKIGCTFCLCAVSTSRTFLIYLTFKMQNVSLSSSLLNHTIKPRKHIFFRCMIIYSVIGACTISSSYFVGFWPVPFFMATLAILVIAISIIVIKHKVSDGLACVKENYFVIIATVFIIIFSAKFPDVLTYFGFAFVSFLGFITLYLPLVYIYKIKRSQNLLAGQSQALAMVIPDYVHGMNANANRNDLVIELSRSEIDVLLHLFLRKKNNYILFREYLAHCFAVESLMFVESVVILWHLLDKKRGSAANNQRIHQIVSIKFDYLLQLNPIYKEYQENIENIQTDDFEQCKDIYLKIYNDVFEKFVASDALYQINIPCQTQQQLNYIFLTQKGRTKLQNIGDFLSVYDDAAVETYQLMENVYSFNFKKYVIRKTAKKLKDELSEPPKPSFVERFSNTTKPTIKNNASLSLQLHKNPGNQLQVTRIVTDVNVNSKESS